MATTFSMLDTMLLMEKYGPEKMALLQNLQSVFAKDLDLHASLRSMLRIFCPPVGPEPSDWQDVKNALREHGYKLDGGWEKNQEFWKGMLTKQQYDSLTTIYESVLNEQDETEISNQDYATWARVMREEAKERNLNLNNKQVFTDLAFDVLDNDSKLDLLGIHGDRAKKTIIAVLWNRYNVKKAQQKIKDTHNMIAKSAQEDEEEAMRHQFLISLKDKGKEAFEKSIHNQLAKGVDVESACSKVSARCPHPQGTTEHKAWMSGYNEALQKTLNRS